MKIKEKAKKLWKEHKKAIVAIGVTEATLLTLAASKGYKAGFVDGAYSGFHLTVDWFEKHFPEAKCKALWETWRDNNPDGVVHRVSLGKWK